jgi:GNAT superfamily N-acetyltransferase
MITTAPLHCIDLVRPDRSALAAVRRLYERTLPASERIPWAWIERTIWSKATGSSACWNRHLLVAVDPLRPADLYGYLVATFFPGYGGYVSYMGVDERARGRGVGTLLYESAFDVLRRDAALIDEELPFVVWESREPHGDGDEANWAARMKLFDRVGAKGVRGIDLWTADYECPGEAVPYQLFVKPAAVRADAFTPGRLRKLVHDHYRRIYKQRPGDEHYDRTFAIHPVPRLRPAMQAGRITA